MLSLEELAMAPQGYQVNTVNGVYAKGPDGMWRNTGSGVPPHTLAGYRPEPVRRELSAPLQACMQEFRDTILRVARAEGQQHAGSGALLRLGLHEEKLLNQGVQLNYLWFMPPGTVFHRADGPAIPYTVVASPGLANSQEMSVRLPSGDPFTIGYDYSYRLDYVPPFLLPTYSTPRELCMLVWDTLASLKQRHGWCGAVDNVLERARLRLDDMDSKFPVTPPAPVYEPGMVIRYDGRTLVRSADHWVDTINLLRTTVPHDGQFEVIFSTNTHQDRPLGQVLQTNDAEIAVKTALTEPMWTDLRTASIEYRQMRTEQLPAGLTPGAVRAFQQGQRLAYTDRRYAPFGTQLLSGNYVRVRSARGWYRRGTNPRTYTGFTNTAALEIHWVGDGVDSDRQPEMAF